MNYHNQVNYLSNFNFRLLISVSIIVVLILFVNFSKIKVLTSAYSQEVIESDDNISTYTVTHGPLVGAVTSNSAVIWARIIAPQESTSLKASLKSMNGENVRTVESNLKPVSSTLITNSNWSYTWKTTVNNLTPNTRYYVDIQKDGLSVLKTSKSSFKTFETPGINTDMKFIILTDFATNTDNNVFKNVALNEIPYDFLYIGGDFWHTNADKLEHGKTYTRKIRYMYRQMYNTPNDFGNAEYFVNSILKNNAIAHCFDDHDSGRNNTDKNYAFMPYALSILQEYFPTYKMSEYGCWQKFTYGQLEFFILDGRSQRDPVNTPSDVKSMLDGNKLGSKGQLEWLKNGLLSSTAKWKIIFSQSVFNPTLPKNDAWHGFLKERSQIVNFIKSNKINNVVFISGDSHGGAIDNGKNSDFPEMLVPAIGENCWSGTSDYGKWTQGTFGIHKSPCSGYGVVTVKSNPDALRFEVKDENAETRLSLDIPAK